MEAATRSDWFPLLTDEERAFLEGLDECRKVFYPAGTVIIRHNEQSDFAMYLDEGQVRVVAANGALVELPEAPAIIGDLSAATGEPRSADVVAQKDIRGLLVPGSTWRDFIATHNRAACAHLRNLASRHAKTDSARGVSITNSTHQVASAILKLAAGGVGSATATGIVLQGITQRDLGSLAKVSRESANAVLRQLREEGVVSTGRGRIIIHDLDAVVRLRDSFGGASRAEES
jgi:CRP-like cAMP-binding protein